MGIYTQDVQKLYIAYFNRPADTLGLAYWEAQADANGSTAAVANAFSASQEYKDLYAGKSSAAIVDAIYQNLFARAAEPAGLTYWGTRLDNGTFNIGNIVTAVMTGAQGADITTVTNKATAADAFTTALDTSAEIIAYSGAAANTIARTWLAAVTSDTATLTAATAGLATVTASVVSGSTASAGTTFTLTTATDSLTGTSGNDTFVADNATLSAADTINGGTGTDVLSYTDGSAGGVTLAASLVSGVETVNVRNVNAAAAVDTVVVSNLSGATALNSNLSTAKVVFTGVATGSSVGMIGNGSVTNGAIDFTMATTSAAQTINLANGTKAGNITNTTGTGTIATINSTGAANTVGTIDLATGATISTLTVNAASNLTATLAADYTATAALTVSGAAASVDLGTVSNFKTIDASGLTAGGLTIAVGTNTTSFKGGAGNDVVTTAAVATTTASTIDAGAGTADKLVVAVTGDVDTAAEAKVYSGFDVLQVGNGVTADASLFTTSTITSLVTSGTATINNVSATQAAAVSVTDDATTTLTVTGATTVGQLDTLNLTAKFVSATLEAADADNTLTLTAPSAAGVETVNVSVGLDATLTNFAITSLTNLGALTNLTLTGTAKTFSVTSGDAAFNVNTVIDGSALATALTVDLSGATTAPGNGVSIKGGSAADTLIGTKLTDVIVGGAGNDTITAGVQATGQVNTVTGGAGGDLITITAGENTKFVFTGTDSTTAAVATPGYAAASMDTIGVTGLVLNGAAWVDGAAGTKYTLATGVTATAVTFSSTAVTFGTTAVTNAGDFYVYDTGAGGVEYIYQDTNGNSKIDAGEFGVKIVGTTSGDFAAGEYSIVGGNLTYISA